MLRVLPDELGREPLPRRPRHRIRRQGHSLENGHLASAFEMEGTGRVALQIDGVAGLGRTVVLEPLVEPHTPARDRMGAAVGTDGRHPIVQRIDKTGFDCRPIEKVTIRPDPVPLGNVWLSNGDRAHIRSCGMVAWRSVPQPTCRGSRPPAHPSQDRVAG